MNTSIVITSINPPTECVKSFAKGCAEKSDNWRVLVVGDEKSDDDKWRIFSLLCSYYALKHQKIEPFKSIAVTPVNSYARKNIGYLLAMTRDEADVIIDTDDDNKPYPSFFKPRRDTHKGVRIINTGGWFNIYKAYSTSVDIWPRGFPLTEVLNHKIPNNESGVFYSPIQQGLVDGSPDVDAIHRLTQSKRGYYFSMGPNIALSNETWCPFNSQNTTWFKEAFPLLYLPTTVSSRACDIIRSLIAQKIAWVYGWEIMFHEATVCQERNPHDLLRDFSEEVELYLFVNHYKKVLEEVPLFDDVKKSLDNLYVCYAYLISAGLIDSKEIESLNAWCKDIKNIL